MEYGDLITELAGRQTVADIDRRLILYDLIELVIDLRLGKRVKSGGGLVKDDKWCVLVECAGDCKLSSMTYGNGTTVTYLYDALDRIDKICYNNVRS